MINETGLRIAGYQRRATLASTENQIGSSPIESTGQATAMVINDNDQVERRNVTTERAVGNRWLIADGLNGGDRLIVEGLQKVQPGMTVKPVNVDNQ